VGKPGRPPVLDEKKRAQIIAIITVGCSQTVAAQFVGCAPTTIQNTADRDPKFADELGKARSNAELVLVNNIRHAAKQEKYWRAAAWALERGFPEKYARRGPDVITVEHIGVLLAKFSQIVVEEVPENYRSNIVKKMDAVARALGIVMKWESVDDPH
jgi:hypothetical protein